MNSTSPVENRLRSVNFPVCLNFEISVCAGADCIAGASLSGFHMMAFAGGARRAPAVVVDELDAGGFQSQANLAACLITAAPVDRPEPLASLSSKAGRPVRQPHRPGRPRHRAAQSPLVRTTQYRARSDPGPKPRTESGWPQAAGRCCCPATHVSGFVSQTRNFA
jgi:hypothetical protein